jgi:hypothetical protein
MLPCVRCSYAGGAGALLCTIGVAGGIGWGSEAVLSSDGEKLGKRLYEITNDD